MEVEVLAAHPSESTTPAHSEDERKAELVREGEATWVMMRGMGALG